MNFYCRERPHIRQMLIRDEVRGTKCFLCPNRLGSLPKLGLPKGLKHDTFPDIPRSFQCTRGVSMLSNLPFRFVIVLSLILKPGRLARRFLSAQQGAGRLFRPLPFAPIPGSSSWMWS